MAKTQSSHKAKRQRAEKRGRFSESLATGYLRLKNYKICQRNYKTRLGEIDIIARKGDLLIIIEVKARNSVEACIDAVSNSAQRRIQNAAELYLATQKDAAQLSTRFDIIAMLPMRWPVHIKDAF